MDDERRRLLSALAATQFGLIAVWQLAELGFNRTLASRCTADEGWTQVEWGVYLLPGHQLTPLAQCKAMMLRLGQPARLSRWSAAFVLGLTPTLRRPLSAVVPADRSARPRRTTIHELARVFVEEPQPQLAHGIESTSPLLTIGTLAAVADVGDVVRVASTAHRKRLLLPSQIDDLASRWQRVQGAATLRAAANQLLGGISHTRAEALTVAKLREWGYAFVQQHVVEDQGRILAELDIALLEHKIIIDVRGSVHEGLDAVHADEDRDLALLALGWLSVPVDEDLITRSPQRFKRRLEKAIAAQARRAAVTARN